MDKVIDALSPKLGMAGGICSLFSFVWKFPLTALIGLCIGAYLYLHRRESERAWKYGTAVIIVNLLALVYAAV